MILSGTHCADEKLTEVQQLIATHGITPRLAVIQVGHDPGSDIYVARKTKVAASVGIALELHNPATATTDELVQHIKTLNERADVHGILVQLPLPAGIDTDAVIAAMDPRKDVDGFHPEQIAAFLEDRATDMPVLLRAVSWLLEKTGVSLGGAQAVIIGKSDVFLHPLGHLLEQLGMRARMVKPEDLPVQTQSEQADVLIVAVGIPRVIAAPKVKPGAIVIDIGINRTADGKVVGDVDFESVAPIASYITPTPGGVGPVTIAALMWSVTQRALKQV